MDVPTTPRCSRGFLMKTPKKRRPRIQSQPVFSFKLEDHPQVQPKEFSPSGVHTMLVLKPSNCSFQDFSSETSHNDSQNSLDPANVIFDSSAKTISVFQEPPSTANGTSEQKSVEHVFDSRYFDGVLQGVDGPRKSAYREVAPLVSACLEGKHAAVLAYGQTGSGKTHLMEGRLMGEGGGGGGDGDGGRESWGLVAWALEELLWRTSSQRAGAEDQQESYLVSVSMVEVYHERVCDLLAAESAEVGAESGASRPGQQGTGGGGQHARWQQGGSVTPGKKTQGAAAVPAGLELKLRSDGGYSVEGLRRVQVGDLNEALALLETGYRRRRHAATAMNQKSSRSFLDVILEVEVLRGKPTSSQSRPVTPGRGAPVTPGRSSSGRGGSTPGRSRAGAGGGGGGGGSVAGEEVLVGTLHLMDMAGSERQTATNTTGERLKEASSINSTLSVLRKVVEARSNSKNNQDTVVAYKESKVTKLLKEALCGDGLLLLFCCLSCDPANTRDTLSTLKFALSCRSLRANPVVRYKKETATIQEMRRTMQSLEATLKLKNNQEMEERLMQLESRLVGKELEIGIERSRVSRMSAELSRLSQSEPLPNKQQQQQQQESEDQDRAAEACPGTRNPQGGARNEGAGAFSPLEGEGGRSGVVAKREGHQANVLARLRRTMHRMVEDCSLIVKDYCSQPATAPNTPGGSTSGGGGGEEGAGVQALERHMLASVAKSLNDPSLMKHMDPQALLRLYKDFLQVNYRDKPAPALLPSLKQVFKVLKSPVSAPCWSLLLPFALSQLVQGLEGEGNTGPLHPDEMELKAEAAENSAGERGSVRRTPEYVKENLLDTLAGVWCHLNATSAHHLEPEVAFQDIQACLDRLVVHVQQAGALSEAGNNAVTVLNMIADKLRDLYPQGTGHLRVAKLLRYLKTFDGTHRVPPVPVSLLVTHPLVRTPAMTPALKSPERVNAARTPNTQRSCFEKERRQLEVQEEDEDVPRLGSGGSDSRKGSGSSGCGLPRLQVETEQEDQEKQEDQEEEIPAARDLTPDTQRVVEKFLRHSNDFDQDEDSMVLGTPSPTSTEFSQAHVSRALDFQARRAVFQDLDRLRCPSLATTPPSQVRRREGPSENEGMIELTFPTAGECGPLMEKTGSGMTDDMFKTPPPKGCYSLTPGGEAASCRKSRRTPHTGLVSPSPLVAAVGWEGMDFIEEDHGTGAGLGGEFQSPLTKGPLQLLGGGRGVWELEAPSPLSTAKKGAEWSLGYQESGKKNGAAGDWSGSPQGGAGPVTVTAATANLPLSFRTTSIVPSRGIYAPNPSPLTLFKDTKHKPEEEVSDSQPHLDSSTHTSSSRLRRVDNHRSPGSSEVVVLGESPRGTTSSSRKKPFTHSQDHHHAILFQTNSPSSQERRNSSRSPFHDKENKNTPVTTGGKSTERNRGPSTKSGRTPPPTSPTQKGGEKKGRDSDGQSGSLGAPLEWLDHNQLLLRNHPDPTIAKPWVSPEIKIPQQSVESLTVSDVRSRIQAMKNQ